MYSYEDRRRAIQRCIRLGKRVDHSREVAIDRVGRAFAAPAAQPQPSIWNRIKSKLRAG